MSNFPWNNNNNAAPQQSQEQLALFQQQQFAGLSSEQQQQQQVYQWQIYAQQYQIWYSKYGEQVSFMTFLLIC